MRMLRRRIVAIAAGVAIWVIPAVVTADPIVVTAGNAAFRAEVDTVTLFENSLSFVPVSTAVPILLQNGNFEVNFSSFNDTFPFTLSRRVTIGAVSRVVPQSGQISITPSVDTLTLFPVPTITFDLGPQGQFDLTVFGTQTAATTVGDHPFSVRALVAASNASPTPTPEPATLSLLGIAIGGWAARRTTALARR